MAQDFSHQPLTVEAWVHSQASPYGYCSEEGCTGTRFSLSALVLPFIVVPLMRNTYSFMCH
jgi:hypothetical protein